MKRCTVLSIPGSACPRPAAEGSEYCEGHGRAMAKAAGRLTPERLAALKSSPERKGAPAVWAYREEEGAALVAEVEAAWAERDEAERRVKAVLAVFSEVLHMARGTLHWAENPGGQQAGTPQRLPISVASRIVREFDRLDSWAQAWDRAHEEVTRAGNERDAALSELSTLTAQNRALVDEVAAANAALERAHRELVMVRAELARQCEETAQAKGEVSRLERELVAARRKASNQTLPEWLRGMPHDTRGRGLFLWPDEDRPGHPTAVRKETIMDLTYSEACERGRFSVAFKWVPYTVAPRDEPFGCSGCEVPK